MTINYADPFSLRFFADHCIPGSVDNYYLTAPLQPSTIVDAPTALSDPNDLNVLNDHNVLNDLNDLNHPNDINDLNQTDQNSEAKGDTQWPITHSP